MSTKTPAAVHPLRMSKSVGGVSSELWHVFDANGSPVANYLTEQHAALIVTLAAENAKLRAALERVHETIERLKGQVNLCDYRDGLDHELRMSAAYLDLITITTIAP